MGIGYTPNSFGPESSYVVRILPGAGVNREVLSSVVDEASAASGITLAVGADATSSTPDTTGSQREIIVSSGTPTCGSTTGCASMTYRGGRIVGSSIVIAQDLRGDWYRFLALHEMGHALGLLHYDRVHDGRAQVMGSQAPEGSIDAYRSGDLAGLAAQGAAAGAGMRIVADDSSLITSTLAVA